MSDTKRSVDPWLVKKKGKPSWMSEREWKLKMKGVDGSLKSGYCGRFHDGKLDTYDDMGKGSHGSKRLSTVNSDRRSYDKRVTRDEVQNHFSTLGEDRDQNDPLNTDQGNPST